MSRYDFVAIDFETASGSLDSACSVGIVAVKNMEIVDTFYSLIRPPENRFSPNNIAVHGITLDMTENAPTLTDLWPDVSKFFDQHIPVVAHNAQFDMSVLRLSTDSDIPDFPYVDSISISAGFVDGDRSLVDCAASLGIDLREFDHHDASDDAKLCALLTMACISEAGCVSLWEFLAKTPYCTSKQFSDLRPTKKFISRRAYKPPREPRPEIPVDLSGVATDGPLAGKKIVFTGELSIDRTVAEKIAVSAGALVKTAVSKKTDFLIVGEQIYTDGEKSAKEKKAEELNASGVCCITTLTEKEFFAMAKMEMTEEGLRPVLTTD